MIVARRLFLLAGALLCAAASLTPLGAQQPTGTITGQVIDSATRQPLAGVNVVVEGTRLGAVTRDDGTFTIVGVPAGTHTVRARRIGYGSVPVVVNVSDGSTVSVAFVLEKRAAVLDQVVVVGYTTQRKSTITGAVATVDAADVESRRVPDVAQALQGQVAEFFEAVGSTLEQELARYDGVIFFESAAVGGMQVEGGNPIRTESIAQAAALDARLQELWSRHPRFIVVHHNHSFLKKIMLGLAELDAMVSQLSAPVVPVRGRKT